ncbi:probable lysophospholipase BODYGUARD 3 isoform X1 [Aristolochia californica]|uniref:probable lysophospholipase BODYGUARD 3 isoform X1 n=1 Tax=Aristolochia californica TaxID=171875 RepID=UPI0035E14C86
MGVVSTGRLVLTLMGRLVNEVVSFIVFCILDLLDVFLCVVFKLVDFIVEAEWRPCYCSSAKEAITSSGKILVSERGESKIVCLCSRKLQLEDISDTLYTRPSLVSEISKTTVKELKRLKLEGAAIHSVEKVKNGGVRSTVTINSTIVEMLQGKIGGQQSHPIPRWSDCDCETCTSWSSSGKETLYVRAEGAKDDAKENVLFIHGFISSSAFWTETLFPNFSEATKSQYRLIAIDLLGFGRSPKPTDSLYTLREHIDMIERSVLEPYNLKSFHIVAHSLGSILALALAVKYPGAVKSLTLLAPPYFPVANGEENGTQFVLRQVAPRRVWPLIAFGASIACWYEHISRLVCLVICKHHRLLESIVKQITRNRIRTFLCEGFFCHTHYAAWHTLHNIICGTANKMDGYLDAVRDQLKCQVTVFHGRDDELLPVDCSYAVRSRIPRADVKVVNNKDHISIVVGRQKAFARELEDIWKKSSG